MIQNNADQLHRISDIVSDEIERHIAQGGQYYDETASVIAARAIRDYMPQLATFQGNQVTVESQMALLAEGASYQRLSGARTKAVLSRVCIQQVIESTGEGDSEVVLSRHDLFMTLTPQFVDPDPDIIVFGNELYVPFCEVRRLDADI